MKTKIAILGAAVLAIAACVAGCSTSSQSAVEKYLFDTKTNYVETVVPVATNVVERQVAATNAAGAIVIQPVREMVVETELRRVATIEMQPSPALKSWGSLISASVEAVSPGSGSLVGVGLLGLASFFGLNRQKRLTAVQREADGLSGEVGKLNLVAENFGQSIEVLREVLKTTPQGKVLDGKIVDMLQRNQVSVGIIREAAGIVANSVSNEEAKRIAQKILEALPSQAGL